MARARSEAKKGQHGKAKRRRRAKVPENLVGARYVRIIEEHLHALNSHPTHGNRELFLDQLVVAHLLAFFNPAISGLRSIEDVFEHPKNRKRYGTPRLPKSTVSDAQRVFDPELLLPLIDSLRERTAIQPHDPRLDKLTQKLLAVDGSFFAVAPRIAWALYNQSKVKKIRKGQIRLHVVFDVLQGVPESCTVTSGQVREDPVLQDQLEENCLYVLDRGFQSFDLLSAIIETHSDVVVRQRKSLVTETVSVRPLSDEDVRAGVISDHVVRVGAHPEQYRLPTMRVVEVEFVNRDGETKRMLLLTSLIDQPAWMIALIYLHRWQVELFFRWLKCSANFQHFFSEDESGMTLQVYVMMIALLLIAVETGARPSKYDYALLAGMCSGLMPVEGTLQIAARRRRERQRAAERQRQKKTG